MSVAVKYHVNLVRALRADERKEEKRRLGLLVAGGLCFGILLVCILHVTLTLLTMEGIITTEREKLRRLEDEYRKYAATRLLVEKSDLELLDSLQGHRIFWTRKLAAMAVHLPEHYWITKFGYEQEEYKVNGFGYISLLQEQLVTLDEYLNQLRLDSTYNDVFTSTYLNSTERQDEEARTRVGFSYSSLPGKAVKR